MDAITAMLLGESHPQRQEPQDMSGVPQNVQEAIQTVQYVRERMSELPPVPQGLSDQELDLVKVERMGIVIQLFLQLLEGDHNKCGLPDVVAS